MSNSSTISPSSSIVVSRSNVGSPPNSGSANFSVALGRRTGVVDDVEGKLAVVRPQPGAAADDLLELRHGAHGADQDHVLAGRGVDARGQKVRGGQDHRGRGLDVLEAGAVGAADVTLVRGDSADVVGMLS